MAHGNATSLWEKTFCRRAAFRPWSAMPPASRRRRAACCIRKLLSERVWRILPVLNPWVETIVATGLIAGCGAVGWRCSRLPKGWWLLGYVPPLFGAVAVAIAVRRPDWALNPLLSWIFVGRLKVFLMGSVVAMLFSSLIPRLPQRRDRIALSVLAVLASLYVGVWPSLAVIANRQQLAAIQTKIDPDGVCRQSTDYTCGPAAAVTGLRILGLKSEEGELAILARTSTATGTPPDVLAKTLADKFGSRGLTSEFRRFHDVRDLRGAEPVLVLVKFAPLLDHWICVEDVTESEVVVADPLSGLARYSYAELESRWRHVGIALARH